MKQFKASASAPSAFASQKTAEQLLFWRRRWRRRRRRRRREGVNAEKV
jgi:hypothetical protein